MHNTFIWKIGIVIIILLVSVAIFISKPINEDNEDIENTTIEDKQDYDMNKELYELVKNSVVYISMSESAGSGIIWDEDETGVVIVSNRHLLIENVEGNIEFNDGTRVVGQIIGYSQQYDIGFIKVDYSEVSNVDYKVARHPSNMGISDDTIVWTIGEEVLQTGYVQGQQEAYCGEVQNMDYMPLFNCDMLLTQCHSRAGMSGGAVFDREGMLIGMISGGDAVYTDSVREADITYSIPVRLIEVEYCKLK